MDRWGHILRSIPVLLLLAPAARAQLGATTGEGRKVLLYPNGRWTYADSMSVDGKPWLLPPPPLEASYAGPARIVRVRFRQLAARRNSVTKTEAWLARHGLKLPSCRIARPDQPGDCPSRIPAAFLGGRLVSVIKQPKWLLMVYGANYADGRFVIVASPSLKRPESVLDFVNYLSPPQLPTNEFTTQGLTWLHRDDDVLYVCNGHRTYAKSSRGRNAYLSAISLQTRKLLWRSRPLVCNTRNFVVHGGLIISGYGFTAEPDYVYAIDRQSGRVVGRHKLSTGPDYVLFKEGRLYVRTYDRDYEFELARARAPRRRKGRRSRGD